MKKALLAIIFPFLFLLIGCSKQNTITNPPSISTGGINFKFDPAAIPSGVTVISATLTRTGYTSIIKNLNLISDSTADISIPAIQIGTWHLKVDAKNNDGTILYTGETDLQVQENVVVQLNLTLNPVSTGMGTIYIFVTWGTSNSGQWIDYGGNPILTSNNNPSFPNGVNTTKILYDNGVYKMWYDGIYNSAVASIWYAESQDGINWNTVGSTPVLSKGESGSWDAYAVTIAAVIKSGNTYMMYYNGHQNYSDDISTGLALSTDGIHWSKNPAPIIGITDGYYHFNFMDVVKKDSVYYGYGDFKTSSTSTAGIIFVATSIDGLTWLRQPILNATLTWESGSIGFPTVIYDNNTFKMIYSTSNGAFFGSATSTDGFNFIKSSDPMFSQSNIPNGQYSIWYPNYRKINNVSYLYYTGDNSSTGQSIRVARNFNQ
ncbi:MAG: hypothetical protein P4L35_15450 [Ignavibacteriaceae bacterium]|nr:hypothetical protein [Ignavibacteriaceae bacterium]